MRYDNFVETQLDEPLLIGATSVTLQPAQAPHRLPPADGGVLVLADSMGSPSSLEIIRYAARDGLTLTGLDRGLEGTDELVWPRNSYCYQSLTAGGFESVKEIIDVHVDDENPHPQYLSADSAVSVSGPASMYITQSGEYKINNYDSFIGYIVQSSAGSANLAGDTITLDAPLTAGGIVLTIHAGSHQRDIPIEILPEQPVAPAVTSPAATNVTGAPKLSTAPFALAGPNTDTHASTDWEVWTGASRSGTLLWSSLGDTVNLVSIDLPDGILAVATDYHITVRHTGAIFGSGDWTELAFTTAANFNSYIATPTPTPAMGAPFEGGFYMGMFWNQLAQSSDSKVLATGAQTFTVADMSATPIVYGGQVVEVRSRANPANRFKGVVTGALGATLTLNVTSIEGSGTFSDWSVMARFRNIVAPKSSGENASIAIKNANTALPVACQTLTEGLVATNAMADADSAIVYPAAHWAKGLNIGGYTDWHIPARDVLELCWRYGKTGTESNYVTANRGVGFDYKKDGSFGDTSTSHGVNNNSEPAGVAYTAGSPAQTTLTAFKSGGAEAFIYGSSYYWASTEFSATFAWLQGWDSSLPGGQYSTSKTNANCVRAVRRSII